MRWTRSLLPTMREIAKDAEATSHQLMLKGGFVRKLASGIYSYLPLGYRVLQKVSRIVRDEMNQAGAIELLLPALHPAEIWKQSGRYDALGADKIAFKNRSGQEFVLGPTHEEVITELAGAYLKSHHQLPRILYQIQTKFRDELRPRFGIIRTKEFIMKDAYSFDANDEGLDRSYQSMYKAYEQIFERLGLEIDIVNADPGIMGGNVSHEFMVRSPYGEDRIAVCTKKCGYIASQDIAKRRVNSQKARPTSKLIEKFDTPNLRTIDEITSKFKLKSNQLVKTLLYYVDKKPVAACVRGDHEVNEGKLRRLLDGKEIRLARPEEIRELSAAPVGFTGPVGLKKVSVVLDSDVAGMSDAVTGANEKDRHFRSVNFSRDVKADKVDDLRYVDDGDLCPECEGKLKLVTSMEIGHVFKLGTRYSKPLKASFRTADGKDNSLLMGCYGIGVNRVVAAIVEQNHDDKGIAWPRSVAPYDIHLITVNHQDAETRESADRVYEQLADAGLDCLYDDRNERAGVKFNDADLIGCSLQVTISARNLKKQQIEVKNRCSMEAVLIPQDDLLPRIKELLNH